MNSLEDLIRRTLLKLYKFLIGEDIVAMENNYKQYKFHIKCPVCDSANKHSLWMSTKMKYEYHRCESCTIWYTYHVIVYKGRAVVYNVSTNYSTGYAD